MRILPLAIVTAIALAAAPSTASTIAFKVTGGELAVSFGLVPFHVSDDVQADDFDASGSAHLVSGPGGPDVIDDTFTNYSYGPGTLTLTLSGTDQHGNPLSGSFVAPTFSFGFTVCEGCDSSFGGGLADDFSIGLGAGVLDAQLATLFGVKPGTVGGFIDFGLEDIDGDPDSTVRLGFDHRGFAVLEIDAIEAPEPSLLLMLAAGGAAIYGRRGISRVRSSGPRSRNP